MMGLIVVIGGVWVFQDSLASLLYYLNKDGESWYYNQALRVIRLLWGIALIVCGVILVR